MAKLENGTSVEELAQLAGTTYKNMWNRIRRHEVKDGQIYMKNTQLRNRRNKKEAPEEKPEFLTKTFHFPKEACIHMEACNAYGTGKCTAACNNYQPNNPRDLLPVVKAEAVPIQQTEANPEAVPELITVTKEVYETIKYKLDCCEISIAEAREAIRQEEKRRDAWAAILERLKIEDIPEGET